MIAAMRARGTAFVFPLLGLVFGVAAALFKGEDWGVRTVVGNLSAPWLVLPFLAGWSRRSFVGASGLGAATSLLSVVGFYVCYGLVFALVNSHTLSTDLAVAGRRRFSQLSASSSASAASSNRSATSRRRVVSSS